MSVVASFDLYISSSRVICARFDADANIYIIVCCVLRVLAVAVWIVLLRVCFLIIWGCFDIDTSFFRLCVWGCVWGCCWHISAFSCFPPSTLPNVFTKYWFSSQCLYIYKKNCLLIHKSSFVKFLFFWKGGSGGWGSRLIWGVVSPKSTHNVYINKSKRVYFINHTN